MLFLSDPSMFESKAFVGQWWEGHFHKGSGRFGLTREWQHTLSLQISTPNCCLNLSALLMASFYQLLNSRAQSSKVLEADLVQ